MARRPVVEIDQSKCDGCGQCVSACAEGAIELVDGKARLVSDVYCDGLGACLGECPRGAIRITEREAAAFDKKAVHQRTAGLPVRPTELPRKTACPGAAMLNLRLPTLPIARPAPSNTDGTPVDDQPPLCHWPIQLHLVPPAAPFLRDADLFLVADCVPFACSDFHQQILQGRPVVIGCPKLDDGQAYVEKLTHILGNNPPRSLTIVHMEVPCCTRLATIAMQAHALSGAGVPMRKIIVSRRGEVLSETPLPA